MKVYWDFKKKRLISERLLQEFDTIAEYLESAFVTTEEENNQENSFSVNIFSEIAFYKELYRGCKISCVNGLS